MRKIWCKLYNFILNTFTSAVEAVAYALKTVGAVAVEILGAAADAVGGAIGSIFGGSNFIVWAGVGILAYFVLTKQDDKDKQRSLIGMYGANSNAIN